MSDYNPEYRGTSDDVKAKEYGLPGNDLADVWNTFSDLAPADLVALRSYMIEKYEQMENLLDHDDEDAARQARIFGEWHWARAIGIETMIAHKCIHGPDAKWGDMTVEEQRMARAEQFDLTRYSERTQKKIRNAVKLEDRDRKIAAEYHKRRADGSGYEDALYAVAEQFEVSEKTVEAKARQFPKEE